MYSYLSSNHLEPTLTLSIITPMLHRKVDRFQFSTVGRVLTDDNRCEYAREAAFAEKGLTYGYNYVAANWTQVAGNGGMSTGKPAFGENAFKSAYADASHTIIHRTCGDCESPDHKHVYHRRFTAVPDNFDLLYHLMNGQNNAGGKSRWGVDFQLYSTFEDAVNDENRWQCRNNAFNYGAVFDGECSPTGKRVRNQWLKFTNPHGSPVRSVGLYVPKPSNIGVGSLRSSSLYTSEDIGMPLLSGHTSENDGVYHVACGGVDIWNQNDEGHFKSRPESGDIEVVVKVEEIAPITDGWAKAGIMLRSNLDSDAVTAFGLLSGTNGVALHTRLSKGNYMSMPGGNYDVNQKSSWLKLSKIGSTISFYYSNDGVTWTKHAEETVFFPDDEYRFGLACTSHDSNDIAETTFSNYEVSTYNAPTTSPTVSSAPTAWEPNEDIGEPLRSGEYWADVGSATTKLRGGGSGIWGTNDSFFFHSNQYTNGDFSMTAQITGFGSGYQFSKGGLMIRGDGSSDASNVFVGAMGAYKGMGFQSRAAPGEATVHHGTHWVNSNKAWVKLIKAGSEIEALYRVSTSDEWTSLGVKSVDFAGATKLQVGYAVTVGNEDNHWNYADLYIKNYSIE